MNRRYLYDEDKAHIHLWVEVLYTAVKDYIGKYRVNPAHKKAAEHYLFHSKNRGIGSFLWICNLLRLDPERVRKALKQKKGMRGNGIECK